MTQSGGKRKDKKYLQADAPHWTLINKKKKYHMILIINKII